MNYYIQPPEPEKSFLSSKIVWGCALICILIFGIIISLPVIVSIPQVTHFLVEQIINKKTPYTINGLELNLHWFKGQQIRFLNLENDFMQLQVESIDISEPLYKLIFSSHPNLGQVEINSPKLTLNLDSSNLIATKNIDNYKLSYSENSFSHFFNLSSILDVQPPISFVMYITDGMITTMIGSNQEIKVSNIQANLKLPEPKSFSPIIFYINAQTRQNETNGELICKLQLLPQKKHLNTYSNPFCVFQAELKQLPILLISKPFSKKYPSLNKLLELGIDRLINLSTQIKIESYNNAINLNFASKNLDVRLQGQTINNHFTLNKPAEITWKVCPEFVRQLYLNENIPPPFKLDIPFKTHLVIEELSLPSENIIYDWLSWEGKAYLKIPSSIILSKSERPSLSFKDFFVELKKEKSSRCIDFGFSTQVEQQKQEGMVQAKAQLSPDNLKVLEQLDELPLELNMEVQNFPSAGLDFFLPHFCSNVHLFGNNIHLMLSYQQNLILSKGSIQLRTPLIKTHAIAWEHSQNLYHIRTEKPISIQIIPELIKAFNISKLQLEKPVDLNFQISKAVLNENFYKRYDSKNELQFSCHASPVHLVDQNTSIQLIETFFSLVSHPSSAPKLSIDSNLIIKSPSPLATTLGVQSRWKVIAELSQQSNDHNWELSKIDLFGKNDIFQAEGSAKIQDKQFSLLSPIIIKSLNLPLAIQNFLPCSNIEWKWGNYEPSILKINQLDFPLNKEAIDQTNFVANLFNKSIGLTLFNGEEKLFLNDLEIKTHLSPSPQINSFHIQGTTQTTSDEETGKIDIEGLFKRPKNLSSISFTDLFQSLKVNIRKFPSAYLDIFGGNKPIWSPALGRYSDISFQFHINENNKCDDTATLLLQSPHLFIQADLIYDNLLKNKDNKTPLSVVWNIPSKNFNEIMKLLHSPLELLSSWKVNMEIDRLNLPLDFKQLSNNELDVKKVFTQAQCHASIIASSFHIKTENSSYLYADNLKGEIILNSFLQPINFEFMGCFSPILHSPSIPSLAQCNNISLNIGLWNMLKQNGFYDISKASATVRLEAKEIPSAWTKIFLFFNPLLAQKLESIIGTKMSLQADANIDKMNGPINIDLKTSNIQTKMDLSIQEDHLTLLNPTTISIEINESLRSLLTRKINPLLISLTHTEKPISIVAKKQGFEIPLHPFQLNRIEAPSILIQLDKVYAKNEGIIASLARLLNQNLIKKENIGMWCTPANIKISSGIVSCNRMDILIADNIHIATWGTIDLNTNVADMYIALCKDTLEKAFHIPGLPEDYAIIIPMKGKTNNIKLNLTAASTQIAALIAFNKKPAVNLTVSLLHRALDPSIPTLPSREFPLPWENVKASKQGEKGLDNEVKKTKSSTGEDKSPIDSFLDLFK